METIDTNIASSERDLFDTSTSPYVNYSYGLETARSNNSQELFSGDRLLFIDSTVEDYQVLTDSLVRETELVILDSQRDGIVQITESLQQYSDLEAIHIVSHGDVGELSLGNAKLNSNNLYEYDDLLSSWNNYLKEDGDILLYGCNVGAGANGREFVESFSKYTAADVSASTNLTGSQDTGGDWDLEYTTGDIEADLAFDAEIEDSYQHTLANLEGSIRLGFDDGFEIEDGFNDRFNDAFNDQIDRQLFGSGDGDEVDASDYSTFANVSADSLVNLARNGLNFAEVSPGTLATIDFNNIPAEDFQFLKNAGLSLTPLSFEALSNVNLGTIKNFDYLSQIDLSQTRFGNLTVFAELSSTFVANANLYSYKAELDIGSGLNLDKIEQLSLSDFKAIDYAFDGDEIFDSVHYTALRKTLNGANPYTDYVENGWKLGLDPHPLFDTSHYLARNTDVRDDGREPLEHYITTGYTDSVSRDPHPLFDTSYYQDSNTDIVNANKNPLLHYIESGFTENLDSRDPNRFFDSSYYSANNPKVVEAGMNPLVHYLQFGWKESRRDNPGGFNPNRDPSPFFDTSFYFDRNIDVLQASYTLDSANPVQHALEYGVDGLYADENRITHPLFESENQVVFTTFIDSNSEGFEAVQNEINNNENGIEISPSVNGEILVTQAGAVGGTGNPIEKLIDGIIYSIYTAGSFLVIEGGKLIYEVAEGSNTLSHYSFSPGLGQTDNIFVSPRAEEGEIIVERFPRGASSEFLENFTGEENIFYTPLEPLEDISSTNTTFPQRDEILDGLLDGTFVFPGAEETPIQVYLIDRSSGNPFPVGSSSSMGIQDVEDFVSGLSTINTPTNEPFNFFEIEQTGTLNYRIPTGQLNSQGRPETFDIDGFRGRTILDTKYVGNPTRSPFIESSQAPQFIKDRILRQEQDQFRRTKDIIDNPSIPFTELEIIVNDINAAPYFESLLEEFDIPGRVEVVPTVIQ